MAAAQPKHRVKEIEFLGRKVPIVLQAAGGPSPLLSIVNVLLLRNSLQLRPRPELSPTELLSLVASKLLDLGAEQARAPDGPASSRSLSDAVAVLPRLASPVALDVRFTRIHDFDLSAECAVFDLMDVFLVHGWLPDPSDSATVAAVGGRTRSAATARLPELADAAAGGDVVASAEAALLRAFLDAGAASGGLSAAGHAALLAGVPDRQLCVLYRAGAFHAAFKREDIFYLLVTDEPPCAAAAPAVTWEALEEADGENALIDAAFATVEDPTGAPLRRPKRARDAPLLDAQLAAGGVSPAMGADPAAAAIAAAAAAASAAQTMRAAMGAAAAGAEGGEAGGGAEGALDGAAGGPEAAFERDHAVALRLQETFEEQERAARKAVRQAASRLQLQQERGAGGADQAELRAFIARVENHMGINNEQQKCSLM